jgi:hypothetical protein
MMSVPPTNLVHYGLGIPSAVLPLKAAVCVFDICQHQSYISIKDQMIRARLLAEWLYTTHLLGDPIKRVLVVGGGVAGVCTALLLTEYGMRATGPVDVTLVDQQDELFSAQAACSTRFVSLTQYDWPAKHFDTHELPSTQAIFHQSLLPGGSFFRLTVPSQPTRASNLVTQWRADFRSWDLKMHGKLRRYRNTGAALPNPPSAQAPLTVLFEEKNSARQWSEDFDLIVFATGFNLEQIPDIVGFGRVSPFFWEDDDYADPNVSHGNEDFAIVGMGDGALQDFLRLTCDPSLRCAADIIDKIKLQFVTGFVAAQAVTYSMPGPVKIVPPMAHPFAQEAWLELQRQLADIDRQATLGGPWDSYATRGMFDLDADVLRVVHVFTARYRTILEPAIDAVLRRPPYALNSITLIAPDPWPSKCYMLNRFLFALIVGRLKHAAPALGLPHVDYVQAKVDPATQLSYVAGQFQIMLPNPRTFHHVVWRVGVGGKKPVSLVDGLRVAIGKHALPFYPPDRFQ